MTELREGDLTLTPFLPEHFSEAYLGWLNDPEVMTYTEARFTQHDKSGTIAYLEATRNDPNCRFWRILIATHEHVGNIRLSTIDQRHQRADVAILIGEKGVWGSGIATRAIRLVCDYAFGELRLHKLTAGVYEPNAGCIRAFEKAKFKVEAIRPRHFQWQDGFVDGIFLGLFASDHTAKR